MKNILYGKLNQLCLACLYTVSDCYWKKGKLQRKTIGSHLCITHRIPHRISTSHRLTKCMLNKKKKKKKQKKQVWLADLDKPSRMGMWLTLICEHGTASYVDRLSLISSSKIYDHPQSLSPATTAEVPSISSDQMTCFFQIKRLFE